MELGIDPKVDYAFKKFFGNEEYALLLVSLLNAVLAALRPVTGVNIVRPDTEKANPLDKLVIGDVKAQDQGGRQFHLEMQWQAPWFFPKRVLFYWAKFHPQQLREGENYITLRPTVSICFLNQVLFNEVQEYHLLFRLREQSHNLLFSDDLEIHLLELPKFLKNAEELSTPLDRWLYFLRHGASLDPEKLPATLDFPDIRTALEVLTVFTQDDREREFYELRRKYQLDQSSLLQDAQDTGFNKGLEKGREEGAVVGQIRLSQELLKQVPTPPAELSALSPEQLSALLEQLRNQLLSKA